MLPVDAHIKKTNLFLSFFSPLVTTTVVAVGSSPGKVTLQSAVDIKVSVDGSCFRVSGPRQTLPAVLYPKRGHTATNSHLAQYTLSKKKILAPPPFPPSSPLSLPSFSLSLSTLQGCYPLCVGDTLAVCRSLIPCCWET